jgi:hypothetical protein
VTSPSSMMRRFTISTRPPATSTFRSLLERRKVVLQLLGTKAPNTHHRYHVTAGTLGLLISRFEMLSSNLLDYTFPQHCERCMADMHAFSRKLLKCPFQKHQRLILKLAGRRAESHRPVPRASRSPRHNNSADIFINTPYSVRKRQHFA